MSRSQLILIIGSIVGLLVIPLLAMLLVRLVVPLEEPYDPSEEFEPPMEISSLRDYWEGAVPHLRELRDRLFKAIGAVILGAVVGFWLVSDYSPIGPLPELIISHFAPGRTLEAIGVAEVFVNYMGIALLVGFAIAIPVVVYQLVAFFAPGLTGREKRVLFSALPFITELFLAGLAFGWFFTIPAALDFLLNFGTASGQIEVKPTPDNFFSAITRLLLWNGLVFELPAIVYLLARLGIVNTQQLSATRRYALVAIVIAAAVITPTGDPYNLLLLAIPMYLLYELGILLSRLVPKRAAPQADSQAQTT
ncbi:MAG TPA: twin-arginine translocase subunit TatC [Roseiflexaceae bacterium]|nr:twin-arginine translocase subunit TatC [Roseiflexaceae bacterium]